MVWKSNLHGFVPEEWEIETNPIIKNPRPVFKRNSSQSSKPTSSSNTSSSSSRRVSKLTPMEASRIKYQQENRKRLSDAVKVELPAAAPGVHEIAGMEEESHKFVGMAGKAVVERDKVPPQLANTLDVVVGQLALIGKTMSILESRLEKTEAMVEEVAAHQKRQGMIAKSNV